MNFEDLSQKASCPYNKNHIFDKQKLMFHLNRCKDKQKVGHLFDSCQYNRIHILPKQDIQTHQIICPDKDDIRKLTIQLRNTMRQVQDQRERSREKVKKQEEGVKKQVKVQPCANDYVLLDDCPICKRLIQKLSQIKQIVPAQTLAKIKTVQKMIKMNNQLIKAQADLKIQSQKN